MAGTNLIRDLASSIALRVLGTVSGAEFITRSGRERTIASMVDQCEEKIAHIKALTHASSLQASQMSTTSATSIEAALNQRVEEFKLVVKTFEALRTDMDEVPRVFRFMTRKAARTELGAILADLREMRLGIENLVMHWSSRVEL